MTDELFKIVEFYYFSCGPLCPTLLRGRKSHYVNESCCSQHRHEQTGSGGCALQEAMQPQDNSTEIWISGSESDVDPTDEGSDADFDASDLAFKDFHEKNVDIMSEAVIRHKLKHDFPTCVCGGLCICSTCMKRWTPTLTRKHSSGSSSKEQGEEFICIRECDDLGNGRCFIDGLGCIVCTICLTQGPDHPSSDPVSLRATTDASALIGECNLCPNCYSTLEEVTGDCTVCYYPVEYMND